LSKDQECLDKLKQSERQYIFKILGIVNENLCQNFANEVQYPEAHCFYGFQIMMETIHNETYSLLIDTYVDDNKLNIFFAAWKQIPAFATKLTGLAERLIVFAAVEGNFFFAGSFCAISC
jgi:ribonucleoside-diphosphate reductase beta chain